MWIRALYGQGGVVGTCVRRQCVSACLSILQCTHENTPPPLPQHDARPCYCRHQTRRPFRQPPSRQVVIMMHTRTAPVRMSFPHTS